MPGLWSQTQAVVIMVSQQGYETGLAGCLTTQQLHYQCCQSENVTALQYGSLVQIGMSIGNKLQGPAGESEREMGGKADVLAPELLHGFNLLTTNRYNWIQ